MRQDVTDNVVGPEGVQRARLSNGLRCKQAAEAVYIRQWVTGGSVNCDAMLAARGGNHE